MNAVFRHGDSGPAVAQITGLLNRIGLLDDGADSVPDPERVYDGEVELALERVWGAVRPTQKATRPIGSVRAASGD